MAGPGVTKHKRESSHELKDKTTTRTTSIYSDKRISEKKPWKTRNLIYIESFTDLAEIRTLTLKKIGLKKKNPVRTTAAGSS